MMPLKYLQTCLQSISFLTKYLHSEAVFLTATMPDFRSLVYEYALPTSKIVDLIEDTSDFDAFQKCKYHDLGEKSLDALLMESSDAPSRLFIVNRKKTARELYQRCAVGKCYHLSTYMTGVDRRKKIADIKRKLEFLKHAFPDGRDVPEEMRITIISTSLIEAGVDLDVHTVFRELAGLDSVLQAGGRCNREGKRKNADVYVFTLEEDGVGDAPLNIERYETRRLLKEYGDISSPEVIKEYYAKVFATRKDELTKGTMSKRCQHFESIPFRTYAEEFSMIDTQNTVSLVAPTKTDSNSIQLVEKLRFSGATKELLRKLQKFTCSISKKEMEDLARQNAIAYYEPGIWCLKDGAYYDEDLGVIFEARDFII